MVTTRQQARKRQINSISNCPNRKAEPPKKRIKKLPLINAAPILMDKAQSLANNFSSALILLFETGIIETLDLETLRIFLFTCKVTNHQFTQAANAGMFRSFSFSLSKEGWKCHGKKMRRVKEDMLRGLHSLLPNIFYLGMKRCDILCEKGGSCEFALCHWTMNEFRHLQFIDVRKTWIGTAGFQLHYMYGGNPKLRVLMDGPIVRCEEHAYFDNNDKDEIAKMPFVFRKNHCRIVDIGHLAGYLIAREGGACLPTHEYVWQCTKMVLENSVRFHNMHMAKELGLEYLVTK